MVGGQFIHSGLSSFHAVPLLLHHLELLGLQPGLSSLEPPQSNLLLLRLDVHEEFDGPVGTTDPGVLQISAPGHHGSGPLQLPLNPIQEGSPDGSALCHLVGHGCPGGQSPPYSQSLRPDGPCTPVPPQSPDRLDP